MDEVQRPILQGEYKLTRVLETTPESTLYYGYALATPERFFAIREFKLDLPAEDGSALAHVSTYFQPIAMKYMDLSHPGATSLRDFFFENGYVYFVVDFIPGYRLGEVLRFRHGHTFPEMLAVSIALQMASTLKHLHTLPNPIYFADLNLSNIIIAKTGQVMLTDFGLGKLLVKYNPEAPRMGSLGYAAPEQIGPDGVVNAFTDMYALGVLMHQLVTGVDPSNRPNELLPITKYNPAISQDYMNIVATATQIAPEKRFVSMADMHYALSALAPQRKRSTKVVERNLLSEIWSAFASPFVNKEQN